MNANAPERGPWVRYRRVLLFGLLTVGFGLFLILNRQDVGPTFVIVRHARPLFVVLDVVLVGIALANLTGLHVAAQRAAGSNTSGLEISWAEMVTPVAACGLFNLAVKSGGMAGLAPLVQRAQQRGRSRGRTIAGYLLVNVLGHLAFAAVLFVSLLIMIIDGRFTVGYAIASVIFATTTGLQMIVVFAAIRSGNRVRALYVFAFRIANIVRRKKLPTELIEERAHDAADELFSAVTLMKDHKRASFRAMTFALGVEVIGVAQLWCVLEAVGVHPSLVEPVIAYAISVLFTIIGFLPGGLGFVEAGLGSLLVSFGLNITTAGAAVILYRLVEFWLPLLIGLVAAKVLAREAFRPVVRSRHLVSNDE